MSRSVRYKVYVFALITALGVAASALRAQHGAGNGEWRSYAGDNGSTRYTPLEQITSVGNTSTFRQRSLLP